MTIMTSDGNRFINVGSGTILASLISTIKVRLENKQDEFAYALRLLETGECKAVDAKGIVKQLNMIKDCLSAIPPEAAVYDMNNPEKEAPWKNKISPMVTSCGNLYTTADGDDLLSELIDLLDYADHMSKDVIVAG